MVLLLVMASLNSSVIWNLGPPSESKTMTSKDGIGTSAPATA